MQRPIYIKDHVKEFEQTIWMALQLLRPLYLLSESGDMWFETLDEHHREDLGMEPFRSDPALYIKINNGRLIDLSGTYFDDILRMGTP